MKKICVVKKQSGEMKDFARDYVLMSFDDVTILNASREGTEYDRSVEAARTFLDKVMIDANSTVILGGDASYNMTHFLHMVYNHHSDWSVAELYEAYRCFKSYYENCTNKNHASALCAIYSASLVSSFTRNFEPRVIVNPADPSDYVEIARETDDLVSHSSDSDYQKVYFSLCDFYHVSIVSVPDAFRLENTDVDAFLEDLRDDKYELVDGFYCAGGDDSILFRDMKPTFGRDFYELEEVVTTTHKVKTNGGDGK